MQQKMSFADKIAYMFMFSSPVLTGNTLSGWSAEGTAEEDDGGQLSSQFLTVRGTAFKALWLSGLFFLSVWCADILPPLSGTWHLPF